MSAGPREYELNFAAANELEEQARRAKRILERLAAHLAASQPQRDPDWRDLVEPEHVRRAAELLFGALAPNEAVIASSSVFVSCSHEDDAFVSELAERLTQAGIDYFKADRDIRPAADWSEVIWQAIRSCRVFVTIVTPRFIDSRWFALEGGAACGSNKPVVAVLRYVDRTALPAPFDRFQAMVVENNEQLDRLIDELKKMCNA